jgi:sodium-independent sulfate anion transporter 11
MNKTYLHFQNISAIDDQIDHINYLHITPDRSVVFTAIDYFMSTVRKASVLYPGVPVVIDLSYVSIADFSTAYVSISCACNLQIIHSLLSLTTDSHVKGFDNLAEDLHKRGHTLVITRAHPGVLTILEGVRGTKLHVHRDGIELDRMLLGNGLFQIARINRS